MKKNREKYIAIILVLILAIGLIAYKATETKNEINSIKTTPNQVQEYSMQIDTTFNLYVFKPNFSEVKLEIGKMPSTNNDSIIFCVAAAYTSSIKDTFAIDNIVGGYVSNGRPHHICSKPAHYGRFVCINDKWEFIEIDNYSAIENTIVEDGSMFTQQWVIKSGDIYRPHARRDSTDNRLC